MFLPLLSFFSTSKQFLAPESNLTSYSPFTFARDRMCDIPILWYHTVPYPARSPTILVVLLPGLNCTFISLETFHIFVKRDLFLNKLIADWLSRRIQLSGIFPSSPSLRSMSSIIFFKVMCSHSCLFRRLCLLMFWKFLQLIAYFLSSQIDGMLLECCLFFSDVADSNPMPSLYLPTIFMRFLRSCL